ncbi:MAG: hypothetical protein ACI8YQ_004723 [Polaribacter sp.]|jgi:hypothetical protein
MPTYVSLFLLCCLLCISSNLSGQQYGYKTKLISISTARPLKAKQGFIHTINGILYEAEVGLTSFLSVGVGGNMIADRVVYRMSFGSNDRSNAGWGVKTKLAFPVGKFVFLGVGTHLLFNDYRFEEKKFNHITTGLLSIDLFGVQLDFGGGFMSRIDLANEEKPYTIFTIGAIIPIWKERLFLISENSKLGFVTNHTDDGFIISASLVLRWHYKQFSLEGGAIRRIVEDGDGTFAELNPTGGLRFFF